MQGRKQDITRTNETFSQVIKAASGESEPIVDADSVLRNKLHTNDKKLKSHRAAGEVRSQADGGKRQAHDGLHEPLTAQVGTKPSNMTPDKYPTSTRQATAMLETAGNPVTRTELQQSTGLKDREHFVNTFLKPMLEAGLLEMTIPEKPRSSRQKYRLTEKGRTWLVERKQ